MKNAIIKNVEFHYANVFNAHAPFGTNIWDVQIRTTSEDTKKELEDLGVTMKSHEDGYFHANVKRKVTSSKGQPNTPVIVVDAAKQPIDPSVKIGHGSTGNVKLFSYEWSQQGRSGKSAMLVAMQITDLKEFTGDDNVDFDVEDAANF